MSAIERAMGYYRRQFGVGWQERWVGDLSYAEERGLLVVRDEVVLIAWTADLVTSYELRVTNEFGVPLDEVLYVHLAVGDLAALADVDGPWGWLCWQRGLRSQKWHWARSVRVLERLCAGRGC